MIKVGQIYKEIKVPDWRKHDSYIYTITNINFNIVAVIYKDGKTDYVRIDWINEDCELIAEYPSWQEAVNSKEFMK